MTQSNTVQLSRGRSVPALGLGTSHMGEKKADRAREVAALKAGIDLGFAAGMLMRACGVQLARLSFAIDS